MLLAILFAAFMVLIALALIFPGWGAAITGRAWLWRVAWANRPSRPFALFAGAGLMLSLAACASLGSAGQSAAYRSTQAFIVAETAFDTVVVTADMAVNSGLLSASTISRVKADVDAGYGYVKTARAAVTAGDNAAVNANAASLQVLVTDITALTKK